MKRALGLTLSLVFASHAWADDTTHSHDGEPPDGAVVVGGLDCSLGMSRSRLPEVAKAVAVEGGILVLCSPDRNCMLDVLTEGSDGPIGSAVPRDGRRVTEVGRTQGSHVPRRPSGWRVSGRSVSWR